MVSQKVSERLSGCFTVAPWTLYDSPTLKLSVVLQTVCVCIGVSRSSKVVEPSMDGHVELETTSPSFCFRMIFGQK